MVAIEAATRDLLNRWSQAAGITVRFPPELSHFTALADDLERLGGALPKTRFALVAADDLAELRDRISVISSWGPMEVSWTTGAHGMVVSRNSLLAELGEDVAKKARLADLALAQGAELFIDWKSRLWHLHKDTWLLGALVVVALVSAITALAMVEPPRQPR